MSRRFEHYRNGLNTEMDTYLLTIVTTLAVLGLYTLLGCAGIDDPGDALEKKLRESLKAYPNATVGVAVRDPSTGLKADINADVEFHAASTMKLAVLIELFRQAEAGRFAITDSLEIRNSFTSIFDGSIFSVGINDDSDKEIYASIGRRLSIQDLAYRLITSSSNLATNILVELVSADSVQRTIGQLGTQQMKVLRGVEDLKAFEAGMNNTTTASDLAILLEAILAERAASPASCESMLKILLDEPWNELIRDALPQGTAAAHKTGAIETRNHRHDAAIVYPPEVEPYILVILTRDAESDEIANNIGQTVSRVVFEHLRP